MALSIVSSDTVAFTESSGADGNITREQIVRYTGYAVGATAVVGSVGVMTVVAPAQMALAAGITAGCTIAANRMHAGQPVVPTFGAQRETQPVASVTAPAVDAPVAA